MLTFLLGSLPTGSTLRGRAADGQIVVLEESGDLDAAAKFWEKIRKWEQTDSAYRGFGVLTISESDRPGCWSLVSRPER